MQVDQQEPPSQQQEPLVVPQEQLQQMQISTQPERRDGRDGANIIMNEEEAKAEADANSYP